MTTETPPIVSLLPDDGRPAWQQIDDLFRKNGYGYGQPLSPLRDEIVALWSWAHYGEALAHRSAASAEPAVAWMSGYADQPGLFESATTSAITADDWRKYGRVVIPLYAAAPFAGEPVVKPLEWKPWSDARHKTGFRSDCYYADGYRVRRQLDETWRISDGRFTFMRQSFPTIEDAKAAAQADFETRIRSALAHPAEQEPGWRPTHRHVKSDRLYQVTGTRINATNAANGQVMTDYQDERGQKFCRERSEFDNGRFEPLSASPATPVRDGTADAGETSNAE